jgi:hypothetical protein
MYSKNGVKIGRFLFEGSPYLKKQRLQMGVGYLGRAKLRFLDAFSETISSVPSAKKLTLIAAVGFSTGALMEWTMIRSGYCKFVCSAGRAVVHGSILFRSVYFQKTRRRTRSARGGTSTYCCQKGKRPGWFCTGRSVLSMTV